MVHPASAARGPSPTRQSTRCCIRAEDLAKGWLLALLEQAPLHDAPTILAADLSRDGPRVCDAVVRALANDADLRRIEPGGALEPLVGAAGAFAGAGGVTSASQAVDALHGVIWSAIRAELGDPDGEQVSDLAERLALVIERVRGAALRAFVTRGGEVTRTLRARGARSCRRTVGRIARGAVAPRGARCSLGAGA